MARAPRIEYEGAVYRVTARGSKRRVIFTDDADREHSLQRLRGLPWSSHRQYIGRDRRFAFVDCGPIITLVGQGTSRPAQT